MTPPSPTGDTTTTTTTHAATSATPKRRTTTAISSSTPSSFDSPSSSSTTNPAPRAKQRPSAAAAAASSIPMPTSDKSAGPVTPTKALLRRIHRRSSVLPSTNEPPLPSLSSASTKSARRISAQAGQLRALPDSDHTALPDGEDDDDDGGDGAPGDKPLLDDEEEEAAVWKEVEQLLDTVQRQNERILELDKKNRELEREVAHERERAKAAREKSDKGLTRLSAIKVEREFLSQEMILKGLQRDNEDKTLEVESLRRRIKVMTDFLAHTYGEDDWQGVVAAGTGSSVLPAVRGGGPASRSPEKDIKDPFAGPSAIARVFENASPLAKSKATFPARLGQKALQQGGNPFVASAASASSGEGTSPHKAANNDDVVIPTVARQQSPLASPLKGMLESTLEEPDDFDVGEAATTAAAAAVGSNVGQRGKQARGSGAGVPFSPDFDPDVLLASIESVRLLLSGFERRNALRRSEMEDLVERATLAEQRLEQQRQQGATAVAPSVAA